MKLSHIVESAVRHFGEMGGRWGINRTLGQIYGLLYISGQSLTADEIAESLGFSRSNISTGLKELQSWRLVCLHHLPGDRREYFSTPDELWQNMRIIADERRRREIDPMLPVLQGLLMEQPGTEEDRKVQARLREIHELLELLTSWFDDIIKLNNRDLIQLLKLGVKAARLLELKNGLPFLNGHDSRSRIGGLGTQDHEASK